MALEDLSIQSPSYIVTKGAVVTLLAVTAANVPGAWVAVRELHKTFVITITGTKSVDLEGSADGVTALPEKLATALTASCQRTVSDVVHYVRASPTSGAGTVAVEMMV